MSFLKGLAFGFLLAATVGPMWILCFRRTLAHGRLFGFVSGMGVATADALYGSMAAFGLTAVSGFLLAQKFWLAAIGGAFLCWLGAKTLLSHPGDRPADVPAGSLAVAYTSTFALTLTNPATILAFVAIFAGLGLAASASYAEAALVVLGVVIGSAFWWTMLAVGAGWLRKRAGPRLLRAINIVAGVSILAFGIHTLGSLLW
ncbi:MAG: LysE family translocator [Burkholderiales bacterium]